MHWRNGVLLFTSIAALSLTLGSCGGRIAPPDAHQAETVDTAAQPADGLQPVLIGFKDRPGNAEENLVRNAGGDIKYTYHLVPAIATSLPPQAIEALQRNPKNAYIEPDGKVQVEPVASGATTPWGIARINADQVWPQYKGDGVMVAILDTGPARATPSARQLTPEGYCFHTPSMPLPHLAPAST